MYKALAKYMYENVSTKKELEDFITGNLTCVMPGKLHSRFNFYKWLYHWLVIGLPSVRRNSRNAMRNLVSAKRVNLTETHINPAVALSQILERLGIKNYLAFNLITRAQLSPAVYEQPDFWVFASDKLTKNVKHGAFGPFLPDIIQAPQYGTGIYRIDHMSIGIALEGAGVHSGHAITGIRCIHTGAYHIIDSNIDYIFPCDWRILDNIVNNDLYRAACLRVYSAVPKTPVIFFVTYVRANMDITTLNMNKMNIRPEKIIQKHISAMNTGN
jgi:hypothetical protein